MKIRKGFVSNSSSSSFVIPLHKLTDDQIEMIYDHIDIAKEIDERLKEKGKSPIYEYYEDWNIESDGFSLWCYTTMDNFDLIDFLYREVKVEDKNILFEDDYIYDTSVFEQDDYIKYKNNCLRNKKISSILRKI